jgi:choline kinase/phosphohistidine swiveling domain-containing protein
MQLFLLGAGRPAIGNKPSALKSIAQNIKAMDWQLHGFESVVNSKDIHFLGGYHVDQIKDNYPHLNISIVPDWDRKTVLETLLSAPFSYQSVFVTYSDTIFRNKAINKIAKIDADVVFGVDYNWKKRFESRSKSDIEAAEVLSINGRDVEFTGLVKFSSAASLLVSELNDENIGNSLIDLIVYLENKGLTVQHYDVGNDWAEFNSQDDIAHFILGTKAETLARLEPVVRKSHIGRQISFSTSEWSDNAQSILDTICAEFVDQKLVVRSSSKGEDNWFSSNAGGFESLLNINANNTNDVKDAIVSVIESYGDKDNGDDQVLVQEFLSKVKLSGVIFTCGLESGSPYYRLNFDDKTSSTESVTAGTHSDLRTVIVNRFKPDDLRIVAPELIPVMEAVQELELLLGYDKLDIEFAIDKNNLVHIFQVRPVTVSHNGLEVDVEEVKLSLNDSLNRFKTQQPPSSLIYGDKSVFANMPDWNPAEIIGTRPKPLAFSLYRQLITNDIWAQQRSEFGYRDVRPYPLIVSFSGQPYVDARASLNSFIPKYLPESCAERIAKAYINILADNPQFHDKIEFEVAFTIWTPDFKSEAPKRLIPYGVKQEDIEELEVALKLVTADALVRLPKDIASIQTLSCSSFKSERSEIIALDKIYSLLYDCKRYGTLAFSHAARAGFVATTFLKSLVSTNVLSDNRRLEFLKSFDTVAGVFEKDKHLHACGKLSLEDIVKKYGHLRPGTYEITTNAYWENPKQYITSNIDGDEPTVEQEFVFSNEEINGIEIILSELGTDVTHTEFTCYMKEATQAREFVKFEFTRHLSQALDMCVLFGEEAGINRDDLSYLEFNDLEQLKLNVFSVDMIKALIKIRKQKHNVTCSIELPPLIKSEHDFYCFERFASQPNFVTTERVEGKVKRLGNEILDDLKGVVVMIQQADPGYDWLFGHDIGGLITQYGGANSHMAIRAAEIGLPAAIGVGEKLYEKITAMSRVELDCANQTIREVQ